VHSVLEALVRDKRAAGVDDLNELQYFWAFMDDEDCSLMAGKLANMMTALGQGRPSLGTRDEWLGSDFHGILAIGLGRSILHLDHAVSPVRARFIPHCSVQPGPAGNKHLRCMLHRHQDWSLSYDGMGDRTGVNVRAAVMKDGNSRICTVSLKAAW
jgi:hypothetical protein